MRKVYIYSLISILSLSSACSGKPIKLGRDRHLTPIEKDLDIPVQLQQLKVGMCEDRVFQALGIDPQGDNISKLDTRTLYEHVSLLGKKAARVPPCKNGSTRLVYNGYRLNFTDLKRSGYFKNPYTWTNNTQGENSYIDLVFSHGAFLSFAEGGEPQVDKKDDLYLWSLIFDNPYKSVSGVINN